MNLFLVTSPFQLICAIEARNHYNTKTNILVIRYEKSKHSQAQMDLLLDQDEWLEVIFLGRKSKIWEIRKLFIHLKKINSKLHFESIFYADYSAWRTAVLLHNITVDKEVMFDDGIGTLREYSEKIKPEIKISRNKPTRDILLKLINLKPPRLIYPREYFSFFTFFNLHNCRFHIENNSLSTIKEKLNSAKCFHPSAKAGFIGQGMVDEKGVQLEKYQEIIKTLIDMHPQGIIYFPHRTEKNTVKEIISSIPHLEYHQSSLPIELEIGKKQLRLCAIYSITSTAAVTIEKIYPDIPIWNIDVPVKYYTIKEFGENFQEVSKILNLKKAKLTKIFQD